MSELAVEQVEELQDALIWRVAERKTLTPALRNKALAFIADWHLKREALIIIAGREGYCTSGCDSIAYDALAIEKSPK